MFGPNALWHSLAGRVSEESGKGRQQQESGRDGEGELELKCGKTHTILTHLVSPLLRK